MAADAVGPACPPTLPHLVESTNYAKFQTSNPVVRLLIDRFYARVAATVAETRPASVLDAGCGEGETIARLDGLLPDRVAGVDLSPDAVAFAAGRFPGLEISRASVYELPFEDGCFDLVLCLEVLEHLADPGAALAELARVSGGDVVVSVPHEPWFRLGSLARGKHVRSLGNHPEHVNHWNRRTLAKLIEPGLELVDMRGAFPWLVARARTG